MPFPFLIYFHTGDFQLIDMACTDGIGRVPNPSATTGITSHQIQGYMYVCWDKSVQDQEAVASSLTPQPAITLRQGPGSPYYKLDTGARGATQPPPPSQRGSNTSYSALP